MLYLKISQLGSAFFFFLACIICVGYFAFSISTFFFKEQRSCSNQTNMQFCTEPGKLRSLGSKVILEKQSVYLVHSILCVWPIRVWGTRTVTWLNIQNLKSGFLVWFLALLLTIWKSKKTLLNFCYFTCKMRMEIFFSLSFSLHFPLLSCLLSLPLSLSLPSFSLPSITHFPLLPLEESTTCKPSPLEAQEARYPLNSPPCWWMFQHVTPS